MADMDGTDHRGRGPTPTVAVMDLFLQLDEDNKFDIMTALAEHMGWGWGVVTGAGEGDCFDGMVLSSADVADAIRAGLPEGLLFRSVGELVAEDDEETQTRN